MSKAYNDILGRMKSGLKNAASKLEGSFTMDNLQSVANELARFYDTEYGLLIDRVHLDTARGEDLDIIGRDDHGVERLKETYEEVILRITGTPGKIIDNSVGVKTELTVFMVTGTYIIPTTGTIEVTARSTKSGAGYGVTPGTVKSFIRVYDGLTAVTNPKASYGGYNRETDEEYVKRIRDYEKGAKGYGNISWYKKTALEVNGVSKIKVLDCQRGKGTVDVIIIADDNKEPTTLLIKQVSDHIEENRIAGADVEVSGGTARYINLSATVYLLEGYNLDLVKNELSMKINEYFEEMSFTNTKSYRVSYAKLSSILIGCNGVNDISDLNVNKGTASIELSEREFPVLGNDIILQEGK